MTACTRLVATISGEESEALMAEIRDRNEVRGAYSGAFTAKRCTTSEVDMDSDEAIELARRIMRKNAQRIREG